MRKIALFSYAAHPGTDQPICRKSKSYIEAEVAAGRVDMIDQWRAQMRTPKTVDPDRSYKRAGWFTSQRSFLGNKQGEKTFLRIAVQQMRTPSYGRENQ